MGKDKKKHMVAVICLFAFYGTFILEARGITFKSIPFVGDPGISTGNETQIGIEMFYLNFNIEKALFVESAANSVKAIEYLQGVGSRESAILMIDGSKSPAEIELAVAREDRRRNMGKIFLYGGISFLALGSYFFISACGTHDGGQRGASVIGGMAVSIPGLIISMTGLSMIRKAGKIKKSLLVTFSYRQTESAFNAGFRYVF
jgi:hypothetical protein